MNREITKFYEKIFEDAAFREKLELKMKEVKSESELKELIKEKKLFQLHKNGKKFYSRRLNELWALLKFDMRCKMSIWVKNLNARNVGAKDESKADLTTKSCGICEKSVDATTR